MKMIAYFDAPIGLLEITGSENGLQQVKKVAEKRHESSPNLPENHPVTHCLAQLAEYFDHERTDFDLKFDFGDATPFFQSVWAELIKIPFGKTRSYSDIAERIQSPKAVRAVGLANRSNPIAIIVPCHRVIGKSGDLTGYFYGLDTKMQLLRHENPDKYAAQTSLF